MRRTASRSACGCRPARMSKSRFPPASPTASRSGSSGQGMPGPGGAGDVLITVSIAPHPVFTLEGADVRLELPITLYEADARRQGAGADARQAGRDHHPAWTSSGRTFRLKGKGFPAKAGRGDLLATVRIVLPEQQRRRARSADEEVAGRKALRSAQGYVHGRSAALQRRHAAIDLIVGGLRDFVQLVVFRRPGQHIGDSRHRPSNRPHFADRWCSAMPCRDRWCARNRA